MHIKSKYVDYNLFNGLYNAVKKNEAALHELI